MVTGDRPPAAGVPNSAFSTGGAGEGLQAKSRRRRCGGSGPSSMAAPGLPGLRLSLPPPRRPALPALARAASPAAGACGSNTNTTPRFRDAAVAGEPARTGGCPDPAGASHTQGYFPLTPRGQRAGAGNLKIKSKQTRRVRTGERPKPGGNSRRSRSTRLLSPPVPVPDLQDPRQHSPPSRAAVSPEKAFRGNCLVGTVAAPPPVPSWRQTERANQ